MQKVPLKDFPEQIHQFSAVSISFKEILFSRLFQEYIGILIKKNLTYIVKHFGVQEQSKDK